MYALTICRCVFQPTCVLCEAKFTEKDALFEHLNTAHLNAKPVSFIPSLKGKQKLVADGHMYCLNYSLGMDHRWRCDVRHCLGKAYTRGQTYADSASILIKYTEHNHPVCDARIIRDRVLQKMCADVIHSNEPVSSIHQRLLASVDKDVAALMPSRKALSRLIQRRRKSKGVEGSRPKRQLPPLRVAYELLDK